MHSVTDGVEELRSTHRMGVESSWREIVRGQFGLIEAHQAYAAGFSKHGLARLVGKGELERVLPRIYRLVGSQPTWEQDLLAAHLWAGSSSAVSHESAALLLGLDGVEEKRVVLTIDRNLRVPNDRIVLHRRRDLGTRDLCRISGMPVTTMPRTLLDLAASLDEYHLDLAFDSAVRLSMRPEDFVGRFNEMSRCGRPGMALMGKVLAERECESGLTESAFERSLVRAMRKASLPLPVCQYEFTDGNFSARIDFAYPEAGIAIEADGYRWHRGRRAFERDRARYSELASRGWRILLVTWLQLKYQPALVVERIRRALATPPFVGLRV